MNIFINSFIVIFGLSIFYLFNVRNFIEQNKTILKMGEFVDQLDQSLRSLKGQTNAYESAVYELSEKLTNNKAKYDLLINKMLAPPGQTNAALTHWYSELVVCLNIIEPERFGPLSEFNSEPDDWYRRVLTGSAFTRDQIESIIEGVKNGDIDASLEDGFQTGNRFASDDNV